MPPRGSPPAPTATAASPSSTPAAATGRTNRRIGASILGAPDRHLLVARPRARAEPGRRWFDRRVDAQARAEHHPRRPRIESHAALLDLEAVRQQGSAQPADVWAP